MKVRCEILNYWEDKSITEKPAVVLEDDGVLSNQVRISIGDARAVVRADELEKAVDACTHCPF